MSMTSSGQCVFSELYAFGHRDPLAMASFCVLLTETGLSAAPNDTGLWEACHQPPLQNKTAKQFVGTSKELQNDSCLPSAQKCPKQQPRHRSRAHPFRRAFALGGRSWLCSCLLGRWAAFMHTGLVECWVDRWKALVFFMLLPNSNGFFNHLSEVGH